MLTEKELAVVRAALRFFCEEFEPHGDLFEGYLSQEDRQLRIKNGDLRRVLDLVSATKPRQVLLDTVSNRLASSRHFTSDEAAETPALAERIKYVTLLMPVELEG